MTPTGLLRLVRAGNLPTIWTNTLAAGLAGGTALPRPWWGLAAAGLSLLYLGGMVLNDIADREWDRAHGQQRPLVTGEVSVTTAWLLAVGGLVGGSVSLLALPGRGPRMVLLVSGLLAGIVGYDLLHKRHALLALALMAGCRALGVLAVGVGLGGGGPLLTLAATAQFGYVLLLTAAARWLGPRAWARRVDLVQWLIAGVSLVDAVVMTLVTPWGALWGLLGVAATRVGQQVAPGD